MSVGFRICSRKQAAPLELVAEFAKLPVANVSDCMGRLAAAVRACGRCMPPAAWPVWR